MMAAWREHDLLRLQLVVREVLRLTEHDKAAAHGGVSGTGVSGAGGDVIPVRSAPATAAAPAAVAAASAASSVLAAAPASSAASPAASSASSSRADDGDDDSSLSLSLEDVRVLEQRAAGLQHELRLRLGKLSEMTAIQQERLRVSAESLELMERTARTADDFRALRIARLRARIQNVEIQTSLRRIHAQTLELKVKQCEVNVLLKQAAHVMALRAREGALAVRKNGLRSRIRDLEERIRALERGDDGDSG